MGLKAHHLKRYKDIAGLLVKYGRSDLVRQAGVDEAIVPEEAPGEAPPTPEAEQLAADLERLGPTFIKLGQLLSTRTDLLPVPYLTALSRLQDDVKPFPFAEAERLIETELGVRISRAFLEFDEVPIAAASLGQVHRARLRSGQAVAVKVQRPGVRETVREDLDSLEEIAELLHSRTALGDTYDVPSVLQELRRSLYRELDYRREAHNLLEIGRNLAEYERILIPRPIEDYTTSRVLTMEYVHGRKITDLSPLALQEIDGEELAEDLFRCYLKQILADGFFHADPHPGNVFITDDGRLALVDLGMAARLDPSLQTELIRLMIAVSEGHGDDAADVALRMGEVRRGHFDEEEFRRSVRELVSRAQGTTAQDLQLGRIIMELSRAAGENGVRPPVELTMVGKTLLNLDRVGTILSPEFEPQAAIRRNVDSLMRQRTISSFSPGNAWMSAIEANELMRNLPGLLNQALEKLGRDRFEARVYAEFDARIVDAMQKVANRITLGLVLAALILGAAMLMRVETTFRIFGYPGIAMILFLAAVAGGVFLVFDILARDRTDRD